MIFLLLVTGVASAQYPAPATYDQTLSDRYCVALTTAAGFAEDIPLEAEVIVTSPIGISTARVLRTDGAKVPYEEAQASITVEGAFGAPIYIHSKGFRTIELEWIGERFIFIRKGMSRIVATEEIYDVVDRRWMIQHTVTYTSF